MMSTGSNEKSTNAADTPLITVDIFKHTGQKNKKIKRADQILPEVYGTTLMVLGSTRTVLEPTIYYTRGERANHYATDAVLATQQLFSLWF
jgi:hypothetical protein